MAVATQPAAKNKSIGISRLASDPTAGNERAAAFAEAIFVIPTLEWLQRIGKGERAAETPSDI